MISTDRPSAAESRLGVRRLDIVHVSPFYWPAVGGAEAQLQALSERLAARGHRVTVVTQKHTGLTGHAAPALPTFETINDVRVIRLSESRWATALLRVLLRPPGSWRLFTGLIGDRRFRSLVETAALSKVWWHALRLRPDVVGYSNYTFHTMAYAFVAAGRWRACPFVGLPLLHLEEPWSRSDATRDLLMRSSALLVNTEVERRFVEGLGFPAGRAKVLGNGVDPADFLDRHGDRVRAAHGVGSAPVIGYVGRLAPNKGVGTLIEAMRIVWKSVPTARLLLAGQGFPTGSPQERAIAAVRDALTEVERAQIIQIDAFPESEKASIFDAIDVFAMPSTAESFGIAFLEAWMCERPVIGARIGAVECVIDHGIDGLLVRPHDATSTAEAILTLVADPDLRRRYGAAGRAKVQAQFTWDRKTSLMEAVYAELVEGRTGRGTDGLWW